MKAAEIRNSILQRFIAGFFIAITIGGTATIALASREEWLGLDNNDSNWTSNGNWRGIGGARQNDDLEFKDFVPRFGFDDAFCPDICTKTERRTNYNDFAVNTSFNSLKFSGANYVINGNQIILVNGIRTFSPTTVFNPNIILGASQTFSGSNFSQIEFNGFINLNGKTLTLKDGGQVFDGLITGSGNLIRSTGTTSVINSSSVSFNTQINGGNLEVNGVVGQVSMQGGTLSGTGNVGPLFALVNNGGAVSPGRGTGATGILRGTGNATLFPGFTLAIDLNGTTVGTQYDQFRVTTGNLVIDGVNLDLTLGFVPTAGQQFTVIDQIGTGTVLGQFAQGQQIVAGDQLFAITYLQNSVVLTSLGQAAP